MNALALALALALGPDDVEERLPRSLSESFVQKAEQPAYAEHAILGGIHVGSADAVDGQDPCLVIGAEWRIHILPWLAAEGSIDYLTPQQVDTTSGVHIFQVPIVWSLLLSPPIDLGPFRPYVVGGGGLTVTHLSGTAAFFGTDLNWVGTVGIGMEFELASGVILDAGLRYVWTQEPAQSGNFKADWKQVTIGALFRFSK